MGRLALPPGWLVTWFEFGEDWDSWEMHPLGDEVVCLLSGAVEFVLEGESGETSVQLATPGSFAIVPRGT